MEAGKNQEEDDNTTTLEQFGMIKYWDVTNISEILKRLANCLIIIIPPRRSGNTILIIKGC
jgi:hypothetical protein